MIKKLVGTKGKRVVKNKQAKSLGGKIYISSLVLGAVLIISALAIFLYIINEESTARAEYDILREIVSPLPVTEATIDIDSPEDLPTEAEDISYYDEAEADPVDYAQLRRLAMEELLEINSDFIGWISIADLINYPIVRGANNVRYLNTTFMGERNRAGAIFMDYRHTRGFDETIKIIYGHLTGDGTMFSQLHRFRNSTFLAENPYIEITTLDGEVLTYRIFAARMTDAWNPAYTLSFTDTERAIRGFPGAPPDAEHFMLLSTCTYSADDDERFLVFAALVAEE
ncbi:MAG: class B sortase [Oscillospiraceae bacterium]|nr:class B sortase [Oscillospiraceae bacterium]